MGKNKQEQVVAELRREEATETRLSHQDILNGHLSFGDGPDGQQRKAEALSKLSVQLREALSEATRLEALSRK